MWAIFNSFNIIKNYIYVLLTVGEYRKQGFKGTPVLDSAKGVTRSESFLDRGDETVIFK